MPRIAPMNALLLPLLLVFAQDAPATTPGTTTPAKQAAGPMVVIDTSMGAIKIRLFKDKSPVTVDNFLKYVRAGHYDGTIFHRVIPKFMIQGGGMEPDMRERRQTLRPPIKNEASNGLLNERGTVSMARTADPNSATAQFFINVVRNSFLDFKPGIGPKGAGYAVFGEVVEGMSVADAIAAVQTGPGDVPRTPVVIKSIREVR